MTLQSLQGFGGEAARQQIGNLGSKFGHVDTPNAAAVWIRIMEMLQGTWTNSESSNSELAGPTAASSAVVP